MKTLVLVFLVFLLACNAQVRSEYEAYWEASPDAVDYFVFWEELTDTTTTQLEDSLDWADAGLTITATISSLTYSRLSYNDGHYVRVGIVSRNAVGIYGLMKTSAFYKKGTIPQMTGSVGVRKK